MATISVTKCQGTGNDFILLDARGRPGLRYATLAKTLCSRRYSIGADGLLVITNAADPKSAAAMRTFNADGSEAEMCGNGIRCLARYLHERDRSATRLLIETRAGPIKTAIVPWRGGTGVEVEMSIPRVVADVSNVRAHPIHIGDESAPSYAVVVGNPHIVIFVKDDPSAYDLVWLAASAIASHGGHEANVELVTSHNDTLVMRIFERGAGETWACGTGACAAAAVAIASGRSRSPVLVHSKGGDVSVAWDGPGSAAVLTGDAELVFTTKVEVEAGEPSQVAS